MPGEPAEASKSNQPSSLERTLKAQGLNREYDKDAVDSAAMLQTIFKDAADSTAHFSDNLNFAVESTASMNTAEKYAAECFKMVCNIGEASVRFSARANHNNSSSNNNNQTA